MNRAANGLRARGPVIAPLAALAAILLAVLCFPAAGLASAGTAGASAAVLRKSAPPAKSGALLTPDKGKFRIRVNGQDVGTEDFEIARNGDNWVAHSSADVHGPDGVTHITATLTLQADGSPLRYAWSTQGKKKAAAAIAFDGSKATSDLRMGDKKPYVQQFTFPSPHVVILDNNLYDQYIVLARLYDQTPGGAQTFSVLVPQELTPGTVTVDSLGAHDSGGRRLRELRVQTADNELDLFLDGATLVRIVAPSANAEITRE